jgi:ornithine carrier protein
MEKTIRRLILLPMRRTPIELVKCRMQVQAMSREATVPRTVASTPSLKSSAAAARNQAPLQGPFAIVRSTIAENGIRGLWLGQVGTLFRETGGSAAWFSAYEMVSRAILRYHTENPSTGRIRSDPVTGRAIPLTKKDLKTWELVIAGASAGVSYNIVLFPADCVKSSMQTQAELNRDAPGSAKRPAPKFWNVARGIYKSRGIAGLYAGCGVTVMRSAPSSAMIFLIYETLEKKFGHLF